jgi:hypothetical protein
VSRACGFAAAIGSRFSRLTGCHFPARSWEFGQKLMFCPPKKLRSLVQGVSRACGLLEVTQVALEVTLELTCVHSPPRQRRGCGAAWSVAHAQERGCSVFNGHHGALCRETLSSFLGAPHGQWRCCALLAPRPTYGAAAGGVGVGVGADVGVGVGVACSITPARRALVLVGLAGRSVLWQEIGPLQRAVTRQCAWRPLVWVEHHQVSHARKTASCCWHHFQVLIIKCR